MTGASKFKTSFLVWDEHKTSFLVWDEHKTSFLVWDEHWALWLIYGGAVTDELPVDVVPVLLPIERCRLAATQESQP